MPIQSLVWILIAVGGAWLLAQLGPVLTPFLVALILAYMLSPGVDFLCRHRFPRWLATVLMTSLMGLIFVSLILVLVPIVHQEISLSMDRIPALVEWFNQNAVPRFEGWFGWDLQWDLESIKQFIAQHWNKNRSSLISQSLKYLRGGGSALMTVFGTLFLVPVVLYYLLFDWHSNIQRFAQLIPFRWKSKVEMIIREIDQVLAQYLRGQLVVMLILAGYYAITLKILGLKIGIPIGIVTGLLVFIPYLGYALGLSLAVLATLLELGSLYALLGVVIIYGLGQLIESLFLTPRLVGERIGLNPVAVIFALLAFGQLFGFFGVLLALPVSAVLVVGLRHLRTTYLTSDFYKN